MGIGTFWADDLPPVDGRLRLVVVGILWVLAIGALGVSMPERLLTCPDGFYRPDGWMRAFPLDDSAGPMLGRWLVQLRVPVLAMIACGAAGLGGRLSLTLGACGMFFFVGAYRGCVGTGHSWYLPMYTLLIVGALSAPDRFSLDAVIARRWSRWPFRPERAGAIVRGGLARKLVLLCAVFMLASAGVAKLGEAGLSWADGVTLQTYLRELGYPKPWARWLYDAMIASTPLCAAASIATLVLELGAPLLLWFPKLRLPFVVAAWLFHVVIMGLMVPEYLPQMTCYLLVVDWGRVLRRDAISKGNRSGLRFAAAAGTALSTLLAGVAITRHDAFPLSYVPMYATRTGGDVYAGYPRGAWEDPERVAGIARMLRDHRRPWLTKFYLARRVRVVISDPVGDVLIDISDELRDSITGGDRALWSERLSMAAAQDLASAPLVPGRRVPLAPSGEGKRFLENVAASAPPHARKLALIYTFGEHHPSVIAEVSRN